MMLYHQTDEETAGRIMAMGFQASQNLEPDSRGRVWFSSASEHTDAVAQRTGWLVQVQVPDEVAESWQYHVDGVWMGSYNPPVEDANSYPRRAYPCSLRDPSGTPSGNPVNH